MNILLLHPGAMGESVGRTVLAGGHQVAWVSERRSDATRARAQTAGLLEHIDLESALASADGVISVCPPDQAESVAEQVASLGFGGIYLDANAVAPATTAGIASRFGERCVDGGIIGPPAHTPGTTRLYLSGAGAEAAASWFAAGPLEAVAMDASIGAASALKMAYAAYTKGSAALLLAAAGLAEQAGVADWLSSEWALSQPGLADKAALSAAHTGPKAWRFAGEMTEIAETLAAADLPDGFHRAAAETYRRLAPLKGRMAPTLEEALALLVSPSR